jgi:hypothetical protein
MPPNDIYAPVNDHYILFSEHYFISLIYTHLMFYNSEEPCNAPLFEHIPQGA